MIVRCAECRKLLAEDLDGMVRITCRHCGTTNTVDTVAGTHQIARVYHVTHLTESRGRGIIEQVRNRAPA